VGHETIVKFPEVRETGDGSLLFGDRGPTAYAVGDVAQMAHSRRNMALFDIRG
jgi:hypothetical protein